MQRLFASNDRPEFAVSPSQRLLLMAFARLDGVALGIAVGLWTGVVIFAATAVLILRGGRIVGPTLSLLGQYFLGFEVSWPGSLVGWAYGFVFGFTIGWSIAFLRNSMVAAYLRFVKLQAQVSTVNDFLDQP